MKNFKKFMRRILASFDEPKKNRPSAPYANEIPNIAPKKDPIRATNFNLVEEEHSKSKETKKISNQKNDSKSPVKSTSNSTDQKIWANPKSKIYHLPSQQSYDSRSKNVIEFDSESEAKEKGFRRAKR